MSHGITALPGERFNELLKAKKAPIDAVPTPFGSWSKVCRDAGGGIGYARGWHVVVAAVSGFGKSVAALNIAASAIRSGEAVFFASLEMSGEQIETRLLSICSGIPIYKLEQGPDFDEEAFKQACLAFEEMAGEKGAFYVNQRPLRNTDDLIDAMTYAEDMHDSRFHITDFIQLAAQDQNDPSQIAEVSHRTREHTQDNKIVHIAISQFNRMTSSSKDKPSVYGLMGGSSVENAADQVFMLDHSRIYPAVPPAWGWLGYGILGKNRHGPLLDVPIHFCTRTLRIREMLPDEMPSRDA